MKNRPESDRKVHRGDRARTEYLQRQHQEEALDDALKNTFPASDPVSIIQPTAWSDDLDSVGPPARGAGTSVKCFGPWFTKLSLGDGNRPISRRSK